MTVYVSSNKIPYTNAVICGYEWGDDNKHWGKREWVYYIRPSDSLEGSPFRMIYESEIQDRISV